MFKVATFDKDDIADTACKQLITTKMKKKKVIKGKITKKKIKDETINDEKLREEIQSILSGQNLPQSSKINAKTKRSKSNSDRENKQNKNVFEKQMNQKIAERITVEQNTTQVLQKKKKKKYSKKKLDLLLSKDPQNFVQDTPSQEVTKQPLTRRQQKGEKLKAKLQHMLNPPVAPLKKQKQKVLSLRERMMQRLQAARFRYINEQMYSSDSKEAQKMFNEDVEAFQAYHEGYRQQVNKWPLNPLDVIIKSIQNMPKTHVVADFGCGDAKLAKSVAQEVHSFDLVATNELVTASDMAHVPLKDNSVDVAVFCLSLMGTNLRDYILEANRVLKVGGILKMAEVESRFEDVNNFIEGLRRFSFKNTWKDLSHNLFYFLDFKKESNIKNKKKLPTLSLHPCLYKKR